MESIRSINMCSYIINLLIQTRIFTNVSIHQSDFYGVNDDGLFDNGVLCSARQRYCSQVS